ncbi:RAD51-associated protein 1 [Ochotona princeps]|uniref:RAD51-associated protein 1 n=1 Tax=Ochotona princeps TaxID=9978 RepID=UPI002715608F|nr:RAD51-associated protein 1 [Ochotona princeps]
MVRPVRQKKPVNYSQFEDSDSDDDFVSANVPLHKKSRTAPKEVKPDKPKSNVKNLQVEDIAPQEKTPKKRMALDDKLYQRDLEVALALSVKELPPITAGVQKSQGKYMLKCNSGETDTMEKPPRISNCSVTSDSIDLDTVTEEDDVLDTVTEEDDVGRATRKRKAASDAELRQRKTLEEEGDGDSTSDMEPEFATSEDPTDDSDYGQSEDNDENFTVRKSKVKEIKKRGVQAKSPGGKKEKKSKSKSSASVTSVSSAAAAVETKQSPAKQVYFPAEAARKPLQTYNAAAESRRPKWVPPAASGCSSASSSPLAGATVKSPNQSLRLGLSRLARVKPLHPSAASS